MDTTYAVIIFTFVVLYYLFCLAPQITGLSVFAVLCNFFSPPSFLSFFFSLSFLPPLSFSLSVSLKKPLPNLRKGNLLHAGHASAAVHTWKRLRQSRPVFFLKGCADAPGIMNSYRHNASAVSSNQQLHEYYTSVQ
uniref:Uncharacterized protein n=1 Tax=Parascaris univalens TaxID=6257 RepID=A0A915B604_PARUN